MSDPRLTEDVLFQKPYLGPALCALQGVPKRHGYMQAVVELLAKQKPAQPFKVIEVGSWAGASAITWAKAIQRFVGTGQVLCVDLWAPYFDTANNADPLYQTMNEAAADGSIYGLFLHNLRTSGVGHMVSTMLGASREVLAGLKKNEFAIVYLDGAHDFPSVQGDIHLSMELVREGGILCGDDLELQMSQLDRATLDGDVAAAKDYVESKAHRLFYHPGVTRAVGEAFGEVSAWEGFWAMRKHDQGWEPIDLSGCAVEIPQHIGAAQAQAAAPEVQPLYQVAMISEIAEGIRQNRPASEFPPEELPELVATYHGFNIVRLGKFFYGVSHSIGEVDWTTPTAELARRYGEINFITADPSAVVTGAGLKELHNEVKKLSAAIAESLLRQESTQGKLGQRLDATTGQVEQKFAALNDAIAIARRENDQQVAGLRTELDDTIAAVEKLKQEAAGLHRESDQQVAGLRAELDDAIAGVERLQQEAAGLRSSLDASLARQAERSAAGDAAAANLQQQQGEMQQQVQALAAELHAVRRNLFVRLGARVSRAKRKLWGQS